MPLFELTDRSGAYVESLRLVFRRGKRLDMGTVSRLQDVVVTLLMGLGMTSVEIARIKPIVARQVRNVLARDGRRTEDEAIRDLALAVSLRWGPRWLVEVRDAPAQLLVAMGADVEDVARVLRLPRSQGMIRFMAYRLPAPIASRVSLAAHNAIQSAKPLLDSERTRRETEPPKRIPRRRTTERRPRTLAMAGAPEPIAAVA
jgi:hypothetical protein